MTCRVHTANHLDVTVGTIAQVDESLGYEHTDEEAGDRVLVLLDSGNQEALVVTGDADDWIALAHRILGAAERAR